jgi:hypothetical protein
MEDLVFSGGPMPTTKPTPRPHKGLPRPTSPSVHPELIAVLELLGVLGFPLFFWFVQLLAD